MLNLGNENKFYVDDGNVYEYKNKDEFLKEIENIGYKCVAKYKNQETITYINVPCSLDIETTSCILNNTKTGVMYIWQFGINGIVIYGRLWEEFVSLINDIKQLFELNDYKRLVCYVHNLNFEFQFCRKYFEWLEVFSNDSRKPMYAVTSGIEFRCSYYLTGVRLAKVGEELTKYKVKKLEGDLDYDKKRHFNTPLTQQELDYCINDVRVVMCKIKECMEAEGDNIARIPNTKTGYVRRDVKHAVCNNKKVHNQIMKLKLTTEVYEMLHDAFQGGFTHANALHSSIPQYDVVSYDFTSSYPAVMVSEQFPMSTPQKEEIKDYKQFINLITTHCCLFDITIENISLKDEVGDCPISSSKCRVLEGSKKNRELVIDNGRVRKAKKLTMTITEQDYLTYRKFYDFKISDVSIGRFYSFEKGYLPKPIIEKVLEYYVGKTTLKDVEGKEEEYQLLKAMLNSIFGMMVMDIVRDTIIYDEEWLPAEKPNVDEVIQHYNESKNRFTWYPWGVWITAYARKNLFTGIYECDDDYIYSDTDSMKILNAQFHDAYIVEYNKQITEKLEACLDHYKLDKELLRPKTVEGKSKPLGVWDFDGHYDTFKTLGAKRYMSKEGDVLKTTIAGVPKKSGAKFFAKYDNPFDVFEDGVTIPAEETQKLTHTYCDEEVSGYLTDYLGNTEYVTTKSGIYLEKAPFTIGMSDEYVSLLTWLGEGYDEVYR